MYVRNYCGYFVDNFFGLYDLYDIILVASCFRFFYNKLRFTII